MNTQALKLLTVFIFTGLLGTAQEISLNADFGLSRFNLREINFPTYESQFDTFRHLPVLSGGVGIQFKFDLGERFAIGLGTGGYKLGNREYTVYNTFNGFNPDSTSSTISDASLHLYYVGLTPVLHIKPLHLFFGMRFGYMIGTGGRSHYDAKTYYKGEVVHSLVNDNQIGMTTYNLGVYEKLDFGLVVGYQYNVTEQLGVTLTCYQGINRIIEKQYDTFINYRNSQATLGVNLRIR